MVSFSMSGDPRGKGRPRATVRGPHASVYTDPRTRRYEASVKAIAEKTMAGREPIVGPLAVALRFRIAIPASYSKKRRAAILAGTEPYFGSFDTDNMCKALLDGCNGVVFIDDRQIVRLLALKVPAESPGVDVRVEPYGGAA